MAGENSPNNGRPALGWILDTVWAVETVISPTVYGLSAAPPFTRPVSPHCCNSRKENKERSGSIATALVLPPGGPLVEEKLLQCRKPTAGTAGTTAAWHHFCTTNRDDRRPVRTAQKVRRMAPCRPPGHSADLLRQYRSSGLASDTVGDWVLSRSQGLLRAFLPWPVHVGGG